MAFEVAIEVFVRVELWAVTRQIEYFDLGSMRGQVSLDLLAVMHSQVVQDQEDFSRRVAHQALEEVDQAVRI